VSILYSKETLIKEQDAIKRMIVLLEELLAINLERQLRIAEADIETGEGDDQSN